MPLFRSSPPPSSRLRPGGGRSGKRRRCGGEGWTSWSPRGVHKSHESTLRPSVAVRVGPTSPLPGATISPLPSRRPALPCCTCSQICREEAGTALRPQHRRRKPALADEAGQGRDVTRQHPVVVQERSEEHTSELQSLMRISYAVFCLKKKKKAQNHFSTVARYIKTNKSHTYKTTI